MEDRPVPRTGEHDSATHGTTSRGSTAHTGTTGI